MVKPLFVVAGLLFVGGIFMAAQTCEHKQSQQLLLQQQQHKSETTDSACTHDADCIAEKADCCGCRQGGKQVALAKPERKDWINQLQKKCGEETMCAQVISEHESCKKHPVCEGGKCILEKK